MEKIVVALLAGGDSSEAEISLAGTKHIYSILDRTKYVPYIVTINKKTWNVVLDNGETVPVDKNDFSFDISGRKTVFQYALILIHGTPGENGILQSYFELLNIPYSTCDVCSSAVTFNKYLCKRGVSDTGVALAKDVLINKGDLINSKEIIEKLSLPLFVKPNASGSSFGVSKVKREEDLLPAVEKAFTESNQVLIEECITGVEISCGMLYADHRYVILPATEIVSAHEYFDYAAKYEGDSQEITPARITKEDRLTLEKMMIAIYKQLNCRGLIRIDFIFSNHVPYMIEVNTTPGMSEHSIVPQEAKAMGMSMTELYDLIIQATIK